MQIDTLRVAQSGHRQDNDILNFVLSTFLWKLRPGVKKHLVASLAAGYVTTLAIHLYLRDDQFV